MKILLVRHGKTRGNIEGRYVGRTDEPLIETEKERLGKSGYRSFQPQIVFCSKMLRCIQTTEILFPEVVTPNVTFHEADVAKTEISVNREMLWKADQHDTRFRIHVGLEEMDFGEFEYKNYAELNGDPIYQAWIDSAGRVPFPGGESGDEFRSRSCRVFGECLQEALSLNADKVAFVVHGGTIMSIMDAYALPRADYYSWQVKNGEGYLTELILREDNTFSLSIVSRPL